MNLYIKYFLVISLLYWSNIQFYLVAQNLPHTIDSLQQILKETKSTQSKVDIYNSIIGIYIQQSDSTNAIHNFNLAIKLAKQLNYWEGISQTHLIITDLYFNKKMGDSLALNHLNEALYAAKHAKNFNLQAVSYKKTGIIYRKKGNYNLALQNYRLALQVYVNIEDKEGIAKIQNNMGNVYSSVGNYVLALDYMFKSFKYWEEQNDFQTVGIIANNIGLVHMHQKDYSRALTYFFKSLELMQSLDNQPRIARVSNNIGTTFKELKEFDQSLLHHQKALNIYQKLEDDYGIAITFHNIGVFYMEIKEYDKALQFFEQALEIRIKLNTQAGIASTMIVMGKIYYHLKNYREAETFLVQGKEIAREIGLLDKVKTGLSLLANLYHKQGQYEKAYQAQLSFSQLSDSLLNLEDIRQITLMDANYKFQQQTDSLQQAQEDEKAVLRAYQINQYWWISLLMISVLVSLLVIFILVNRQKNRRKQLDQAIELQNVKHQLLQEQLQRKEIEEKMLQEQLLNSEDKDFELTRQALHLVQNQQLFGRISEEMKEMTKSGSQLNQNRLKDLIKIIRKETNTTEEWQNFTQIFEMAHPRFFHRLQQNFPTLTDNDIRLSALLRLGFDSNEIALVLNITPDSVRRARTRLRKKIGLHEEKLSEFMRGF